MERKKSTKLTTVSKVIMKDSELFIYSQWLTKPVKKPDTAWKFRSVWTKDELNYLSINTLRMFEIKHKCRQCKTELSTMISKSLCGDCELAELKAKEQESNKRLNWLEGDRFYVVMIGLLLIFWPLSFILQIVIN